METVFVSDEQWISHCLDLARHGLGLVSPNPPVGAVLVHEGKIIGEGYHTGFGKPHAEVEAIRSVKPEDKHLIPLSALYVSLEPCCITGKTPPCTDLILSEGIKKVCIGTVDPNPDVAGKGIEILRSNGVTVTSGILDEEAQELIQSFRVNILQHRPYVLLKWAQSIHGFIGKPEEKIWLSDSLTNVWTHSQRAKADAIMVGARTVMLDNPMLTTRDFPGDSPHRVIYDPNGKLDNHFRVFNRDGKHIFYFSEKENELLQGEHISKFILANNIPPARQLLEILFNQQIGILLVEGGTFVHQLFINENLWDEAWVVCTAHTLDHGIAAPNVKGNLIQKINSGSDTIIGILKN